MTCNRRLDSKLFPTENEGHRSACAFSIAFAIKKEGDGDFYHFNDESYYWAGHGGWLNPAWRIGPGIYRVDVELTGYGLIRPSTVTFRLRNNGSRHSDFTLEPW